MTCKIKKINTRIVLPTYPTKWLDNTKNLKVLLQMQPIVSDQLTPEMQLKQVFDVVSSCF